MAALESVRSVDISEENLCKIITTYDNIDQTKILRELCMLPDLLQSLQSQDSMSSGDTPQSHSGRKTVHDWASFVASQPTTVQQLKTWLRKTMTQKRPTHRALLQCECVVS